MTIALACDHTGYEQLKEIQVMLEAMGHSVKNFGPTALQKDDDYPDFIKPAAMAVSQGTCQLGVVIGGSGQGEAIVANRFAGVRCGLFYGTAVAKNTIDAEGSVSHDPYELLRLSRRHNDCNMLSLAARFLSLEEMKNAVRIWLETPFSDEQRHKRRISKLDNEA